MAKHTEQEPEALTANLIQDPVTSDSTAETSVEQSVEIEQQSSPEHLSSDQNLVSETLTDILANEVQFPQITIYPSDIISPIQSENANPLDTLIQSIDNNLTCWIDGANLTSDDTQDIKDQHSIQDVVPRRMELHQQLLIVYLKGIRFSLPLSNVLEITEPGNIIWFPNLPQDTLGLINYRSKLLSVISMENLFDYESLRESSSSLSPLIRSSLREKLIVIRSSESPLETSFLVEGVEGIYHELDLTPDVKRETISIRNVSYIHNVIHDSHGNVFCIDPSSLFDNKNIFPEK